MPATTRSPDEDGWRHQASGEKDSLSEHYAAASPDVDIRGIDDSAQQSMFRDIDTILARLEIGIAGERAAMDALLDRLTKNAA